MQTNKGFTMVEMIFVLFITIIISSFTLYNFNGQKNDVPFKEVEQEIIDIVEQAKVLSINNHSKIILEFETKKLSFSFENETTSYNLPEGYHFEAIKEIYFNENGNINEGNHIDIVSTKETKQLVFNLGAGDYYIK